jgi:hypothetical protein
VADFTLTTNAGSVAADLASVGLRAGTRAQAITRMYGHLLETAVKRHASLPRTAPRGPNTGGPRLITGDYNRSINLRMSGGPVAPTATVGTDRPQGPRLEFGFVGVDSLGRHYDQPPYPHFGPAFDEIAPQFEAAIAGVVT